MLNGMISSIEMGTDLAVETANEDGSPSKMRGQSVFRIMICYCCDYFS